MKPESESIPSQPNDLNTVLGVGRSCTKLFERFNKVGFAVSDGVTDFIPESDGMISLYFKVGEGDKDVESVRLSINSLYDAVMKITSLGEHHVFDFEKIP